MKTKMPMSAKNSNAANFFRPPAQLAGDHGSNSPGIHNKENKNEENYHRAISQNSSCLKSLVKITHMQSCQTSDESELKSQPKLVLSSRVMNRQTKKLPIYSKNQVDFLESPSNKDQKNQKNHTFIPLLDKVKYSNCGYGYVDSYAACTTSGNIRNYNEDRVSIILNIAKPQSFQGDWPRCSFFGVYDGHAGSSCADFLRDHLHKLIISDPNFPENPQKAILNGFLTAEDAFLKYSLENGCNSGSCALVIIIIEKKCYVANVGDSRAIMSGEGGEKLYVLSRDHRPSDEKEYKRIIEAGGKIYQTEANIVSKGKSESIVGPLRVKPGKLSVSRAIGDMEAKLPKFGGNPEVIIGIPEIKNFEINEKYDFILLGCNLVYLI